MTELSWGARLVLYALLGLVYIIWTLVHFDVIYSL